MSIAWESNLLCEGMYDGRWGCERKVGEVAYRPKYAGWPDRPMTATALRRLAREEGWVRRGGRDLCPDCQERKDA